MTGEDKPQDLQGYRWPDWVPHAVRGEVERLWRTPGDWLADAAVVGAPELGTVIPRPPGHDPDPGRFCHYCGRIGRLVAESGFVSVSYVMLSGEVRWLMSLGAMQ